MTKQMSEQRVLAIGCASGFWGDTQGAARQLVELASLDYLVFDYLSEITMSIMASLKLKDAQLGYAPDMIQVLTPLLEDIQAKKIKVVSNAGGINPRGLYDELTRIIDQKGIKLKVAVVEGDNLMDHLDRVKTQNIREYSTSEPLPDQLVSMNAYLGAEGIAKALQCGADIIITGRVVDSALVLGPLVHEFGWQWNDYDKLSQGSLAGHIIECGPQCTGGLFTDWESIPSYENMGFPIVFCRADGQFEVAKPQGTDGLISVATVSEQVVYEIGDPGCYILPNVQCDWRNVLLKQVAKDRVSVMGAKGRKPTDFYKVSATYMDGFRATTVFMVAGLDAALKARKVADAIVAKCSRLLLAQDLGDFSRVDIEILGIESSYGKHANKGLLSSREVMVKIAVAHEVKLALTIFSGEIAQAGTGMVPGFTGLIGGRPKVLPLIRLYSFLIDKAEVVTQLFYDDQSMPLLATADHDRFEVEGGNVAFDQEEPAVCVVLDEQQLVSVPLIKLAHGRSGDKGDHCNIGIIARKIDYLAYITQQLTEAAVADYMSHLLDQNTSQVQRFYWPGIMGFNFLLEHSLGGGGMASLRMDPQGKCLAQQLLDFPIQIPKSLADQL